MLTADDAVQDSTWAWATIGVSSNMEKLAIDWRQACAFARAHGRPVVVWRKPITSPTFLSNLVGGHLSMLYNGEPGLKGLFVKGAPAYLSKNFAKGGVSRGLANGTTCVMHSLTFREETNEERHMAREAQVRIENALPGEVVDLGTLVPLSVNIEHTVTADEAAGWPLGGSLHTPVVNRISNTGTYIIPVICDDSDEVQTRAVGDLCWPGGSIKVKSHALEPAFAITFHKLQGKTISKVILDLRKRPGTGAGIKDVSFEGLYVGWTRVRKGADIRVIPPQDGANDAFDHLMKLGPSAHLISWLNGFVSGEAEQALSWDHNLAASSWVRMSRNNSVYVGPASRSTESRSHGVGRAREVPVNVAEVLQYSTAQIRALLVPTLRAILGALGVRNTGNKAVLIDALLTYQRNRGQGPGGQNDRGSADSAEQQGMETERHSEQNRDASSVQVSRPQSTYIMPPRQVFRVDPCPGGLPIVSMGTLSWFWVPVIAHAMNIQGVPALPPDAVLYQLGAVFSLAGLVDVVRRFIQLGQYNVHLQEIQNRQGYLVYFTSATVGFPHSESCQLAWKLHF